MRQQSLALQWAYKHSWGLGMLIVVFLISSWAVKHFKRPGRMTIIESQAMDMTAMKPPIGSVPVATEFVSSSPFTATVRYTGSVAPLNEQNIYPRVDGWLTGLKVYNGDRVHAGQLVAILDSPDIQDKLSEATYGHIAALKDIHVAQSDLARMKAERDAAHHEIEAASSDVQGAAARVIVAQRQINETQKDLKSAEANLSYWKTQIRREGSLLKDGAVSQQEFDSEQAQYIAAESAVENKQAMVEETNANVEAAQAELSNKRISVQAARDRAAAADAALAGAMRTVAQKAAMADTAGAQRATAKTFNQYRMIRVPFAGVVTKRLLSPGVLVNPGMAILNIAQIDKVRLQANVAEEDLGDIRVGAEVIAHVSKGGGRTIRARVTSITPSADQTSRTAVVEAIVNNLDHYLVPGDFVSMDISTSSGTDAITVPTSALTTRDGHDALWITRCTTRKGKAVYTCTMHPEVISDKPGLCPKCSMPLVQKDSETGKSAHLVYVTTGKSSGDRTEILSGLNPGDEVIYAGNRYLREGDAVTPTKWDENGPTQLPNPPSGAANMQMPGMGVSGNSMPGMDMSRKSPAKPAQSDDMKNMPGM